MGYLSKGYYAVCLSLIPSSVSFMFLFQFPLQTELEQLVFLGVNISIIGIQICGIVLCALGYRKHETIESLSVTLSTALTALLIIWGGFIVFLVSNYLYHSKPYALLWMMSNTVQFAAYVAWAIKGTIGLISGLVFTFKSLLRQHKELETRMEK